MRKSAFKGIVIGGSIILLSIIGMYLGLARYYSDGFSYGTWINGIYCTGKSLNEINDELLKQCNYEGITITDGDGNSYAIKAEDVNLSYDFEEALQIYLDKQNPYLWIDNLLGQGYKKELLPVVTYDKDLLAENIEALPFFEGRTNEELVVQMIKGEEGYYLLNERIHVLNEDKTKSLIVEAFEEFQSTLSLEPAGCYENLTMTAEMQQTIALWNKIDEYQNCEIVYQFGDEAYPINAGIVCDWLLLDENGNFVFDENGALCTDENKVYEFVNQLADEYDTVGATRQFMSTRGELVSVEGGIYGNLIDREAEKEYLLAAFLEKRSERHEPAYTQKAFKQGKNDIGDTYIEVDMTKQMMYYYVKGSLIIETPVVTGNTSRRRGTPVGTNYVYNKQKNRVLRGEDYASPVKFWIPVKGAIGIHDASWRDEYGGEIYKTSGSHGCINTPLEEVSKLYEMVEIGTPCVMFY